MPRTRYSEGIPIDLLNEINAGREILYQQRDRQYYGSALGSPVPAIKTSTLSSTNTTTKVKRPLRRSSPKNNGRKTTVDLSAFQNDEKALNAAKANIEMPWDEEMIRDRMHSARSMSPESDIGETNGAASGGTEGMDIGSTSSNEISFPTTTDATFCFPTATTQSSEEPVHQMEVDEPTATARASCNQKRPGGLILRFKVTKPTKVSRKTPSPKASPAPPSPTTVAHPATAKRPSTTSHNSLSTTTTKIATQADNTSMTNTTMSSRPKPTIKLRTMSYFDKLERGELSSGAPIPHVTAN